MRRVDILGLTLAELSLVLLLAFLVLAQSSRARMQAEITTLQKQINGSKSTLERAAQESKTLAAKNRTLQMVVDRLAPKLRSSATPSCIETKLATGPLFTATIRGANSFEIDRNLLSLPSLLQHFRADLNSARASECVHSIRLRLGHAVSAAAYDTALRTLERHFYTTKLGLEQ